MSIGNDMKDRASDGDAEAPRCAQLGPVPKATSNTDRSEKVRKQVLAPGIVGAPQGIILRRATTAANMNIASYVAELARLAQPQEDSAAISSPASSWIKYTGNISPGWSLILRSLCSLMYSSVGSETQASD